MNDDYSHQWKAERGYYDALRGGWLPDEECDWWEKEKVSVNVIIANPRRIFFPPVETTSDKIDKDAVRERVDLIALLRSYGIEPRVYGKKATARCPVHADKTASFSIDLDKKLVHCFGCGFGADLFGLVMLLEECSFRQALEKLNREY